MRLSVPAPAAEIPLVPLVPLALIAFVLVTVSTLSSVPRGITLELPGSATAAPELSEAVFVKLGARGSLLVDCRPVAGEQLPHDPVRPVILYVDPLASYEEMVAVLDRLGPRARVWVPTRGEIQQAIAAHGANPFERRCPGPGDRSG